MAISVSRDDEAPIAGGYVAVSLEWTRQLRAYTHSVRLYHQVVARSRAVETAIGVRTQALRIVDAEAVDVDVASVGESHIGTDRRAPAVRSPLTHRQLEIAELIAEGLTNAQIAERLVVSPGTVGNHIGHMLRRLSVHNRAQIAAWMIRRGANAD